jgi:hypothetical protein
VKRALYFTNQCQFITSDTHTTFVSVSATDKLTKRWREQFKNVNVQILLKHLRLQQQKLDSDHLRYNTT